MKHVRGVLSLPIPPRVQHEQIEPPAHLRPWVEHLWSVNWAVRQAKVAETVPHPSVHLVWGHESAGPRLHGVGLRVFRRRLEGRGWAFGIKFRPGCFAGLWTRDIIELNGRELTSEQARASCAAGLLPLVQHALPAALRSGGAHARAGHIQEVDQWLSRHLRPPELSPRHRACRDAVELAQRDVSLVRVDQLAGRVGVSVRKLERDFRACVGPSPKWVLRRCRLIEAVQRLRGPTPPTQSELAVALGYYDQAHLCRDVRSLLGRSPSELIEDPGPVH